jgi:hypothetical protein
MRLITDRYFCHFMQIERENPSVLTNVTQVSDVAHEPLVFVTMFLERIKSRTSHRTSNL